MDNKETMAEVQDYYVLQPLVKPKYIVKALQSNDQPDTLCWSSVGDIMNFNEGEAIVLDSWQRQGVYLCSADSFKANPGKAGYYITDYDGYFDLPCNSNMFFKAIMLKVTYSVKIPACTTANLVYKIWLPFCKNSDSGSSSTWAGGIKSHSDYCKTVSQYNCGTDWPGISKDKQMQGLHNVYADNASHVDSFHFSDGDNMVLKENTTKMEQQWDVTPAYLLCMVERPESYGTYLGLMDEIPNYHKIEVRPTFTSFLFFNGGNRIVYEYDDNSINGVTLKESSRFGYILQGWLDEGTGVLYPAKGFFNEKRGVYLREQIVPESATYTVIHDYPDSPKETKTYKNMVGAQVSPKPYNLPAYKKPETITAKVRADGATEIEYVYGLAEYPVQYSANGGKFEGGIDYVERSLSYGKKIPKIDLFAYRQGYTFEKWEPQLPQEMPCGAVTTRIVWTANNYVVIFEGNNENVTGDMEPQEFVYDQPQKLYKNTYECNHAIKYEVVTPTGDKINFEQAVKCGFVGWVTEKEDAKVYNDEEIVCNLTTEVNGQVHFRALWEPASIRLPQFDYEGYYLDAWYENAECEGTPIKPDSEYKPKESVTLYGKLICTKVENLKWDMEPVEPVDERPIRATWKAVEGATAYRVGLEDNVKKVNYPLYAEDFTGDNVTYVNAGAVEVVGTELDFTEALKRFTAGGNFNFSVEPVFDNIPEGSIGRTVSNTVTTLARPENLRWDETRSIAMWDNVEGADYYLMWVYWGSTPFNDVAGVSLADACGFDQYGDAENCVIVRATEADLSGTFAFISTVEFEVAGYSENIEEYYTPLYERIRSETN